MNETAFKLESICFAYDADRPVLDGLDLTLGAGERVAITGANGSGKTTLLHILVGLILPSSGILEAFGEARKEERDFVEVRRRAGLVFQDPDDQLFCPTVADDIAFGPLNLRLPHDEVDRRVSESLEMMGLSGYEDRVTWKLSEGEKRRACIAAVMAMDPDILLLDEPTADLDREGREKLIEVLCKCGKGLLAVSHDREFIGRICDRELLLESGHISDRETDHV